MQSEEHYQSLWREHLFAQAVAYFLFSFLFLRAYSLAGDGNSPTVYIPGIVSFPMPEFPGWVPLIFSFACLGLSVVLGIAAFVPRVRKSDLFEQCSEWISIAFSPLLLFSFAIAWLEGIGPFLSTQHPVAQVFFWAGIIWILVLVVHHIYTARKPVGSRRK
jgi:hypothetical protein